MRNNKSDCSFKRFERLRDNSIRKGEFAKAVLWQRIAQKRRPEFATNPQPLKMVLLRARAQLARHPDQKEFEVASGPKDDLAGEVADQSLMVVSEF